MLSSKWKIAHPCLYVHLISCVHYNNGKMKGLSRPASKTRVKCSMKNTPKSIRFRETIEKLWWNFFGLNEGKLWRYFEMNWMMTISFLQSIKNQLSLPFLDCFLNFMDNWRIWLHFDEFFLLLLIFQLSFDTIATIYWPFFVSFPPRFSYLLVIWAFHTQIYKTSNILLPFRSHAFSNHQF